uniref:Putative secreted peptide n=1 Tax=Anopheles braziliensis TaxID=58242 RepID=A0A2M3ZSG6_9DIPT
MIRQRNEARKPLLIVSCAVCLPSCLSPPVGPRTSCQSRSTRWMRACLRGCVFVHSSPTFTECSSPPQTGGP